MVKKKNCKNPGALFIPAGILTGMGVGFALNQLVAGMFIGLGLGFLAFAITAIVRKA